MTQLDRVRIHLVEEGSITPMDAFGYGITRLAALIHILRGEGMKITTTRETCRNRYGHASKYARYHYREENK